MLQCGLRDAISFAQDPTPGTGDLNQVWCKMPGSCCADLIFVSNSCAVFNRIGLRLYGRQALRNDAGKKATELAFGASLILAHLSNPKILDFAARFQRRNKPARLFAASRPGFLWCRWILIFGVDPRIRSPLTRST